MDDTPRLRCELCETEMSSEMPPGKSVRYFHCAHCGRWVASNYGDELVRAHTACASRPHAAVNRDLGRVKESLASWIKDLDERDPYFVLGVAPSASADRVRERFHELALENHPDRGGDAAQMRRLIVAFDQIRDGKRLKAPPTTVRVAARECAPLATTRRRRG